MMRPFDVVRKGSEYFDCKDCKDYDEPFDYHKRRHDRYTDAEKDGYHDKIDCNKPVYHDIDSSIYNFEEHKYYDADSING